MTLIQRETYEMAVTGETVSATVSLLKDLSLDTTDKKRLIRELAG